MKSQSPKPRPKTVSPVTTIVIVAVVIIAVIGGGIWYLTSYGNPPAMKPVGNKSFTWRKDVVAAWEKEVAAAKKEGRQPDTRRQPQYGPNGNMNAPWKNGLPTQIGGGPGAPGGLPGR
jgi:hypothetical protein